MDYYDFVIIVGILFIVGVVFFLVAVLPYLDRKIRRKSADDREDSKSQSEN
jgi:uncharacterized membrane protein